MENATLTEVTLFYIIRPGNFKFTMFYMTGKFYVYFERKLLFADTLCTYLHCLTGRILTFFIYFSGVFQVVYLDKNNSVAMCNILAIIKIFDKYGRVAIGIALFLKCECLHTSDIFNSLFQPKGKEESASTTI